MRTKGIKVQDDAEMKVMLQRIVAILNRMAMQFDSVAEPCAAYDAEIDCDNEHRCAENEHEISGRRNAWTHGMQRSGGGDLFREITAISRRRLMRGARSLCPPKNKRSVQMPIAHTCPSPPSVLVLSRSLFR